MRALWLHAALAAILALFGSHALASAGSHSSSPPVKVQLRAPWKKPSLSHNGSSLLLEIFEAANARNPDSFFPLVTSLTAPWNANANVGQNHPDDGATTEAEHPHHHRYRHKGKAHLVHAGSTLASLSDRQLVAKAEGALRQAHLFGPETDNAKRDSVDASIQLWRASLALHDQSPRVQAFLQLYHTLKLEQRWKTKVHAWKGGERRCRSWVDLEGQVLCDEDEVVQAIRQAASQARQNEQPSVRLLPFDHVLPGSKGKGGLATAPDGNDLTLILYGDPYSVNFWGLHSLLEAYASGHREIEGDRRIIYVLRWRPAPARVDSQASEAAAASETISSLLSDDVGKTQFLGGYGAYLDLKKVDYLVIDDRKIRDDADLGGRIDGQTDASQSEGGEPEQVSNENKAWLYDQLGDVLPSAAASVSGKPASEGEGDVEKQPSSGSLSKEEINQLGLRATRLVAGSSDPLRALEELSQNFPLHAERLARSSKAATEDDADLLVALLELADRRIQPGQSELWLNGRSIDDQDLNPLNLIKTLSDERRLLKPLLGRLAGGGGVLDTEIAVDLISSMLIGRAFVSSTDAEPARAFFDASDRPDRQQQQQLDGGDQGEGDAGEPGAITWWNNVPTGATARWSNDLYNLLRPLWPGQFPQISLNLFNVVLVLDLSRRESCRFLSESVGPSIGKVALHWGFVPGGLEGAEGDGDSITLARLFWEVYDLGGAEAATSFLRKLASAKAKGSGSETRVDVQVARDEASLILHGHLAPAEVASRLDAVVQGKVAKHRRRERMARSYIERLRATRTESPRGHVFVNGQHLPFSSQLVQMLHATIQEQIQLIAPAIYHRQLTADTENLETYFYDLPEALTFRSRLVFPSPSVDDAEAAADREKSIVFAHGDIVSALDALNDDGGRGDGDTLNRYLYPDGGADREGTQDALYVNYTLWLIGDLDSQEGAEMVRKAVTAQQQSAAAAPASKAPDRFRIGFLHVPAASGYTGDLETRRFADASPPLSAFLFQAMQDGSLEKLTPGQLLELLAAYVPPSDNLDQDDKIGATASGSRSPNGGTHENTRDAAAGHAAEKGWSTPATAAADKFWRRAGDAVVAALKLDVRRGPALLLHGKMIQGFRAGDIGPEDVSALVRVESARKVDAVVRMLMTLKPDFASLPPRTKSDLVSAVMSVASSAYAIDAADEGVMVKAQQPRTALVDALGSDEHVVELGDRATATLRLSVLIDPLSEAAQKWSTILRAAIKLQGVYVRIVLNPKLSYNGEMPLKRFYRFSAPTELRFDAEGREVSEELRFYGMPEQAVLTLGLDVPPAWLTMAEEAVFDLDNIRLSDVPSASRHRGVKAVYELKHILIEGHARDIRGAMPRGLQLVLETPDGEQKLDTIVMANLVYFQFKASPGLWKLAIRSGGRSDEVYEMVSVGNEGWDSPAVEVTGEDITLDTLGGLRIYPVVKKRKGKEDEDLLEELDAQGRPMGAVKRGGSRAAGSGDGTGGGLTGLLDGALDGASKAASKAISIVRSRIGSTSSTALTPRTTSAAHQHADINIFTIASGHLYERMTYIMILSVLKHTSSSVKFWFIENFLSPSFKEFLPHLAATYGFRYSFVTYAWPHWLRRQREKQRTIWGYKILFLDTLFPLDLGKVIFVDADQVVRTDLQELVDIDLKGAVYGYPPMGDDSEDMEGFRFWKQGYWRDYLRGRPYHISALYVVDLHRFRRVAAGDKLRGQYQALSSDPASLANLDQDLPNNMQTMLPIHTLDKEWLWCETWCSHEWLHRAKTIDLCSNPKTKEPKLDRARRQIPEWTEYDRMVEEVAKRVAREKGGKSLVSPEEVVKVEEKGQGGHDEL